MPWDDTARAEHKRETDRYPSDLTDAEWDIIGPLLPPAKTGGRPRKTKLREIMNAILYMFWFSTPVNWKVANPARRPA